MHFLHTYISFMNTESWSYENITKEQKKDITLLQVK